MISRTLKLAVAALSFGLSAAIPTVVLAQAPPMDMSWAMRSQMQNWAHGQAAANATGNGDVNGQPVRIHGIDIDPARRRVNVLGREVDLTDQEFRLLHLLATHAGIVFSREALLSRIWRGDTFVTVRSVDTLVKRLRRRIESDPANPRLLLTVWGVGYKFADL